MVEDRPQIIAANNLPSIKKYWSKKVVGPVLLGLVVVLTLFSVFVYSYAKSQEQSNLFTITKTLALVLSDPLIQNDHLEALKRISTVAESNNSKIIVQDNKHRTYAIYPPLSDDEEKSVVTRGLKQKIISNDGRILGWVYAKYINNPVNLDDVLLSALLIVIFFTVALFWLMNSTKPFVSDIISLAETDISKSAKQVLFRFSETTNTYLTLVEQSRRIILSEQDKVRLQIAHQVAHDIRSPLAALTVATQHLQEVEEDKRIMIRSAVQRIEDITNDLAGTKHTQESGQMPGSKKSVYLLSSIIDGLVSEKRLQFRSRMGVNIHAELDEASYGLFVSVEIDQFKRVISNIINNAVEAFDEGGNVVVTMKKASDSLVIQIRDNGKGIPAEILPKLMQRGATFGKEGGKGLGLCHARETIESLGGKIDIRSICVGVGSPDPAGEETSPLRKSGTTVTLVLPRHEAPFWFVPEIKIASDVVILDDDTSIHQIWENRLTSAGIEKNKIHHFATSESITKWYDNGRDRTQKHAYLFDYEILGDAKTGLDVIEELKIGNQAILITSRYEDEGVLQRCQKLGTRLVPKNLAGFVPIVIQSKTESSAPIEYVLIDDQEMNHSTWQTIGRIRGKSVATFFNPESFFSAAPKLDKQVKIYVDSDLGNGIKGEGVSKEIADMGFSEIYICTGYRSSDFEPMPWVRGVVGKKPPFL